MNRLVNVGAKARLACLAVAVLTLRCHGQFPQPQTQGTIQAAPRFALNSTNNPLVWDTFVKQVNPTGMVTRVTFIFSVTNTSSSEAVTILETETSCDCTVAGLPSKPWVLKPGSNGTLPVRLNTLGRFGPVTNWVGIHTSHGPQLLTVRSDIPFSPAPFNISGRERDRKLAQEDRQAVLTRTDCAACHALPALGRAGKDLFTKACAICHISERRAPMVPDLAALRRATDADYWHTWITHGKTNTLMPAFAKSAGGILDETQIRSLVRYLVDAYPSTQRRD